MLEQAVKLFTTLPAPVQTIITSTAAKLGADLVKALGSKGIKLTKPKTVEKAFENAVTMFAKDMDLKDTENEGILRDFLGREKVTKELVRFSSSLDKEPNVALLKAEFEDAGYVEEQMPGFEFEKGMESFVKTLEEVSLSDPELRDIFKAKTLHQILEAIKPSKNLSEMEKKYREQIAKLNRYVDSRGIAQMKNIVQIELDEIYVPLKARTEMKITGPREKEEEIRGRDEKTPAVRDLSELTDFAKRGVTPRVIEKTSSIVEILAAKEKIVILGDPGSGKTTVLKYLARKAALNDLPEEISDGKNLLPILLPIREYSNARSDKYTFSISKYLPLHLEKMECPACMELLQKKLEKGECLLLFDGLDEVIEVGNRNDVIKAISNFLIRYSNNKFVLTSRIVGYSVAPMVGGFPHYTLESFGMREIKKFVANWCWAMESIEQRKKASKKKAEENAKTLFESIKTNDRVTKLATNPLMCTVIGLIHHQGQKLPNRRIELYDICSDTFISSWERLKGEQKETDSAPDERDIRAILEQVGLWIHESREDNLIPKTKLEKLIIAFLTKQLGKKRPVAEKGSNSLIRLISTRTGILTERGEDLYGFMHLTFQEYFTACALTKTSEFITNIGKYLRKPRWREVILLSAAQMGEYNPNDSSKLIQVILDIDDKYEKYLHRNLMFAMWCLADDVAVNTKLQDLVFKRLKNTFNKIQPYPLQQELGEVLGEMQGTRSEEKALDLLWRWSFNKTSHVDEIACRSLGRFVGRKKELLDRLMELLKTCDNRIKFEIAKIFQSMKVMDHHLRRELALLLDHKNPELRSSAIFGLGLIPPKEKRLFRKIRVLLNDENEIVNIFAILSLLRSKVKEKWFLDELLRMLESKKEILTAITPLIIGVLQIKNKWFLKKLLKLLLHKKQTVRLVAAQSLSYILSKNKWLLKKIHELLEHKDAYVRSAAVSAINPSIFKEKRFLEKVLCMLNDKNGNVRSSAVKLLGYSGFKDQMVLARVSGMLNDKNERVLISAIEALEFLGVKDKKVISRLLKLLDNPSTSVRLSAVKVLGSLQVKDKKIVDKLKILLTDKSSGIRAYSAGALGSLGIKEKKIVEKLKILLTDKSIYVISSTIDALSSLGVKDKIVLNKFVKLLKDKNSSIQSSAYVALKKLTME